MSFHCFVPGQVPVSLPAFQQVAPNRWVVELTSAHAINELACFITEALAPEQGLGCHIACAPFEEAVWHYLGSITNENPSIIFKTRLVWSARERCPTSVQFGVELQPVTQLAARPAEKVTAEVIEAGRRIGVNLYEFCTSFACSGPDGSMQVPANVFDKWLTRFNDKCRHTGLDWLYNSG